MIRIIKEKLLRGPSNIAGLKTIIERFPGTGDCAAVNNEYGDRNA